MACVLCALLVLADAAGVLPGMAPAAVAGARPASWLGSPAMMFDASISPSDTTTETPTETPTATSTEMPTATPTATATPTPAPTLTIISPSSSRGPVEAYITVRGASWGSGSVSLGAATDSSECASSSAWSVAFGAVPISGGAITDTFIWPTSLATSGTSYAICALGSVGAASASYEVLASTPPTLSLSTASARVGQNLTIRGTSFFGEPTVRLTLSAPSGQRVLATISPYGDGTFSYAYAPAPTDTGRLTITATSTTEGGAPPTLQAIAVLVVAAAGTPVPTITPTAIVTATVIGDGLPPNTITPPTSSGPPLWLLMSAALVALFFLLALLAILVMRQPRPAAAGLYAATRTGAPPAHPSMGPRATGRFATSGLTSVTGRVPTPEGPGAVARWEDSPEDSGPGPDWHPRPMGGTHAHIPAIEPPDDADAPADIWEDTTDWSDQAAPRLSGSGYAYEPPTRPTTGGPIVAANTAGGRDSGGNGELAPKEDLGATRGGGPDDSSPAETASPATDPPATDQQTRATRDPAQTNPDQRDELE